MGTKKKTISQSYYGCMTDRQKQSFSDSTKGCYVRMKQILYYSTRNKLVIRLECLLILDLWGKIELDHHGFKFLIVDLSIAIFVVL
jgi:hypothetical protein